MHVKSGISRFSSGKRLYSQQHSLCRISPRSTGSLVESHGFEPDRLRAQTRCGTALQSRPTPHGADASAFCSMLSRCRMMRVGRAGARARTCTRKIYPRSVGRQPWTSSQARTGRVVLTPYYEKHSCFSRWRLALVCRWPRKMLPSTTRQPPQNNRKIRTQVSTQLRRLGQICSRDTALRATDRRAVAPATSRRWRRGRRRALLTAQFSGSSLKAIQTTECRHGRA